jgi:cell wall-associated NlpC family hydrolase
MRRGVWLLVLGVALAAFGAASAFAAGTTTTTTTTTTTSTTTTGTTTTTAPSYAALATSSLPKSCVGGGAAAVVSPSHPAVALGTPASDLGPSAFPASGSVVAFGSSTASGSTCKGTKVDLASVSLFGGVVTADGLQATDGKGTLAGLKIDGTSVTLIAGQTVPVESWGQLTAGETFGRLSAPLVLQLLEAYGSLPAGTRIALAFAAGPRVATHKTTSHSAASADHGQKTAGSGSQTHVKNKSKMQKSQSPPDFPATPYPFAVGGALGPAIRQNAVVSAAMQYLGIPYKWGGANPKTGFDCSGLVTYVFAQLGVSLPHYTVSQWDSPDAIAVQPNRLQAGDLVFFTGSDGTRTAPGHVGIYVGNGYLIDAPHTGSFVRIDRLTDPRFADEYVGARRIESRLLGTRRLLDVERAGASASALRLGFASPSSIGALGASFAVAASSTAAQRDASGNQAVWLGAGPGGLVVLLGAGAFVFRRRRAPDTAQSSESST